MQSKMAMVLETAMEFVMVMALVQATVSVMEMVNARKTHMVTEKEMEFATESAMGIVNSSNIKKKKEIIIETVKDLKIL